MSTKIFNIERSIASEATSQSLRPVTAGSYRTLKNTGRTYSQHSQSLVIIIDQYRSCFTIVHTQPSCIDRSIVYPCAVCSLSYMPNQILEILLLLEKHCKAYDGPIDQQPTNYRHSHSWDCNQAAVGQQCRKSYRQTQISTNSSSHACQQPNVCRFYHLSGDRAHTNTHHNQKPRTKSPKINHSTPNTLHEIIGIRTSPAYPVGQRSDHVGRYDEQGQVAVEESGGEDDEEEAYSKDLET